MTPSEREQVALALEWAAHEAAFGDEFRAESYGCHVEAWLDELAARVREGDPMKKTWAFGADRG